MDFRALKRLRLETSEGPVTIEGGQVFTLSEEEALKLIESFKIEPTCKVAYKIYSKILGCYLWITETDEDMNTLRSQGIDEPIYTSDEIRKLKGLNNDSLKGIHKVKETFKGSKVEEIRRDGQRTE